MNDGSPPRRRVLAALGAGLTSWLAACVGDGNRPTTAAPTGSPRGTGSPAETDATPTGTESAEPEPTPRDETPTAFVERDGTEFVVDGERYVFSGVANCCLAEGYTSKSRVDDVLESASTLNADAIRFKIGSAGGESNCAESVDGCDLSFQPEPGTFDESAFRHLDYIVAEAGRRGIRVILPLVDNWGATGMNQYVDWVEDAGEHADFYALDRAQELYRGFIEHLLTRTNTITGREYRGDPTILLWELANEPRVQADGELLLSWLEESAAFVHELDDDHLVSTGSDVFLGTESPGEFYTRAHAVDGIDACSIHLWPQNWDMSNPKSFGVEYITDRTRRGTEDVGKPVYLGEYGWRVNLQESDAAGQIERRNELFAEWHDAALEADIDGIVAWELMSRSRLDYHRTEPGEGETVGFVCPGHEGTCSVLRSVAARVDERSTADRTE
ncbi:glycoside hydrolase 5 family protein [Halorarum halobium]|uniref:glycoside hydrolase 5 family protein n=1 Tax=Halorarum halobium TaxID=3075121 RepID=UPI0028AC97CE|nr:cellulase family glycosylhydrolase [Halobaculum sp. XH14]